VLKFIRSNKAAGWIKVIFGAIVLVFIFWGVGVGVGGEQFQMVAEVNGETVDQMQFERAHRNLTQFYRQVYKDNLELLDTIDLRSQTVDQLVRVVLLRQEAERLGLGVADSEVRDTIAADPSFQIDGLFDKDRYLRVLRLNKLTPAQYENSQREQILVDKLTNLVSGGVRASEAEVRTDFMLQNEKVKLSYIALATDDFTEGVEVTDEEAKTHFDANAESFREPERVRLGYVLYVPSRFTDQVEVTDEEIQKYYDDNKTEFDQPETVQARHLLLRVASAATDDEKAAVRGRAEAVLARLQGGEDFAALAREVSEDESNAPQGGDLGFFPRGRMVPSFEEAAFSVEPGGISSIVETQFGLHILKVEAKRPAGTSPLEEVRAQIVAKLADPAARELAEKAANAAQEKANAGTALAEVATADGLPVQTSAPVGVAETIPGVRGSSALITAAMAVDAGKIGPVTFTADGYIVFRVEEKIAAHVPAFDAAAEAVRTAVRAEKALDVAQKRGEELHAQLAESSLADVAAAAGKTVQETGPFGRQGPWIAGLGVSPELKEAAFELTSEAPVAPAAYTVGEQVVIAVLGERLPPADAEFEAQKEQVVDAIEARRRNEVMTALLAELRKQSSITMGRGFSDLS